MRRGLLGNGHRALSHLPHRLRPLAACAIAVAGLALALLAGGVADEQLHPSAWGDLSASISRGAASHGDGWTAER